MYTYVQNTDRTTFIDKAYSKTLIAWFGFKEQAYWQN